MNEGEKSVGGLNIEYVRGEASFHSVLFVLWWGGVIFSYKREQHGDVKAFISTAAPSSLTATSMPRRRGHVHAHTYACKPQFNKRGVFKDFHLCK